MYLTIRRTLAAFLLVAGVSATVFPPAPDGLTTIQSVSYPKVSISYKQTQICETTPGVKSFNGYVNLPPNLIPGQDYPIHSFFWFFEARNNFENAPLSLWLQGGPGSPSVGAALGENGPCSVNEDSQTTQLNPWSWNNEVNMLYIDQPVQTGFSYDTLVNGTINQIKSPFLVDVQKPSQSALPPNNVTVLAGTFPSQDNTTTANTTSIAAQATWYFLQTWIKEFPEYKKNDNRFSIWAESYGGHYGPTFASYFEAQNQLIAAGNISSPAIELHIDTLGLINACIDSGIQTATYPVFAFNNTYGLQGINETEYQTAVAAIPKCQSLTETCRTMGDNLDPEGWGNNPQVNEACAAAFQFCFGQLWNPFNAKGHDVFDFVRAKPNPFPPKFAAGYLNTREVQLALGVPLNFTGLSSAVDQAFIATGDFIRGHNLEILGQLLDSGIKVALVYGDRDYQCNWIGGEQVSLAIQSASSTGFGAAGYANISTNDTYVGGVVRQYGNLSFSRVFDAGHQVPYYQPETAYRIFQRAMFNTDVATGRIATGAAANYTTTGPSSSFDIKNAVPPPPLPLCYTWDVFETCTDAQKLLLDNGSAVVRDFIVVG
ncbi:Alpha/Beta hydrolase protein [Mycena albidolilacea]|uniref:Carboxypeptidase n=1 Tax=Mycena albidolilacea TaxID=1033008 RepID=A0AAD7A0T0_9AGAR|nr:Alpha/Beta hydrolase protein [Mycena albidolilacea]